MPKDRLQTYTPQISNTNKLLEKCKSNGKLNSEQIKNLTAKDFTESDKSSSTGDINNENHSKQYAMLDFILAIFAQDQKLSDQELKEIAKAVIEKKWDKDQAIGNIQNSFARNFFDVLNYFFDSKFIALSELFKNKQELITHLQPIDYSQTDEEEEDEKKDYRYEFDGITQLINQSTKNGMVTSSSPDKHKKRTQSTESNQLEGSKTSSQQPTIAYNKHERNANNLRVLLFGITAALLIAAGVFILSQPYSWVFIGIGGGIFAWCVYSGLTTNYPSLFSCFQRKKSAETEEQAKPKYN